MEKEGTKRCKYCKSEIPANAKVCPHCRKKQGVKIWQVVLLAVIVVGVTGAVAGGGQPTARTAQSVSEPAQEQTNAETSQSQQEQTKTEFSQSETVTFRDVDYTVTAVEKTTGTEYDQAKAGYEYVIVSIRIENKSDEKISYNAFDWKMENSNGQEESTTFTIVDSDTALNSGDLNPGGIVEGTVTFEEPQGDTGLKLNYYYTMLDEQASFKIQLD